jgi:transmembrane sensor
MTNLDYPKVSLGMDSAQIEREAAAWLAKRDSGDWGEVEERAFADWQEQSTAHRIAVIRIKTIWQKADRLQALGAGVPRGQIPAPGSWRLSPFFEHGKRSAQPALPVDDSESIDRDDVENAAANDVHDRDLRVKTTASRILKRRALAAALVLGVGAASAWYFIAYDPDSYRSAIGDTKVVSLADGSTVTLNTDSAIHVVLTAAARRIDLDRGEAFFEVAKDPRRPFIVSAAGKRIVAVGTKFSVFRGPLDTRVVVTEGQVKVEEFQAGGAVGLATQLPAGSIAQAGSAGVLVRHSSVAEAETYVSWRSGYIALRDTELADAVAEFNRYNTKQLVIADPAIAEIRVGGNLRATNVEAFVRVLEEGFPVRAEDQGNRIVLTGKGEPTLNQILR